MRRNRKQRLILWVARGMGKTGRLLRASLAAAIPDKRVLMVRSTSQRFKQRDSDTVINWGNSNTPAWFQKPVTLLNGVNATTDAINKWHTFEVLTAHGVNTPEWTTDIHVAIEWMKDEQLVVCRHILTGNSGEGIELVDVTQGDKLPPAPLYVKYKKKKHEFRVHVFNGTVIDICQKRKRRDWHDDINTKIRNIDSGWIFARDDLVIPDDLKEQAVLAVGALGLDFGAVDIIWNQRENKSYVLEVNTAPGLMQTSLARYTQAIKENL